MGWIVALFCVALIVLVTRKTLDRETTRNLKLLGKLLAGIVGLIVLWAFLSFATR